MKSREILMHGINYVLRNEPAKLNAVCQLNDEDFLKKFIKLTKHGEYDYQMLPDFGDTEEYLDTPDVGGSDALRDLMISNLIFLEQVKNRPIDCPRQEDEGSFHGYYILTTPYLVEVYLCNVIQRKMFKDLKKAQIAPYLPQDPDQDLDTSVKLSISI